MDRLAALMQFVEENNFNEFAASHLGYIMDEWANLDDSAILNRVHISWLRIAANAYIKGRLTASGQHAQDWYNGFAAGVDMAALNRCPECGLGAIVMLEDMYSDYACSGDAPTAGYRCPNGHEWEA